MNIPLYVGLSNEIALQRSLDITANNIANSDTPGFKVEELLIRTEMARPSRDLRPTAFVMDAGVTRDFRQGALERTGGAFDLAIEGRGFFQIQTDAGLRYTRDGRFTVNAQSQLVTKAGDPVLGNNGRPITLDPRQGEPAISTDGTVNQGLASVGRIGVFRFEDLSVLQKSGENLLQAPDDVQPLAAPDGIVRQGSIEHSNVQPVLEITNLIEITRAYERVAKMMEQTGDLASRAINSLGQVS